MVMANRREYSYYYCILAPISLALHTGLSNKMAFYLFQSLLRSLDFLGSIVLTYLQFSVCS